MLTKVIILASALLSHPATSAPNPVTSSPNSGQLLGIEDSGQDFNLSLANLLPEASISGSDVGNCASSTKFLSWRTKDWLIEDCYAAVHNLYLTEVLTHPDQPYEFVARGASATKPKLTVQQTPRKYVFRE